MTRAELPLTQLGLFMTLRLKVISLHYEAINDSSVCRWGATTDATGANPCPQQEMRQAPAWHGQRYANRVHSEQSWRPLLE